MQPVSSFTSTTKALISVSSASRTNCHSLEEPKAHALTYSALIEAGTGPRMRSEEHTSGLQSPCNLVCRLLLEKKKNNKPITREQGRPSDSLALHTSDAC